VGSYFEGAIATLRPDEIEGVAAGLPEGQTLTNACRHLLATKGKQLRSTIVLEAARYGPEPDSDVVRRVATATELLHYATLAHDDVVDDGQMRRKITTVAAEYGHPAAAYAGGWLCARAVELVADTEFARDAAEAACAICDGEMLEVQDLGNVARTAESYFDAIAGKTARLFSLASSLGAKASGAPEPVVAALTSFGHDLGMAFQISDDMLDVTGGEESIGKPAGSDLRLGVFTLPVIYAMEEDPGLAPRLAEGVEDDDLAGVIDAIRATDGLERAQAHCDRHAEAAQAALASLESGDPGAGASLRALVDYTAARARPVGTA
jgi:heptaprenyl diphosphate synthase